MRPQPEAFLSHLNTAFESIYLHFPFCETKCHYCDFYSIGREKTKVTDANHFERALNQEIQQVKKNLSPELKTLFFGGGTPSMTSYESICRALEPLWKVTSLSKDSEWSMEVNPSSVSLDNLQKLRSYGVNRISMGIQALKPNLLKILGRVHSREDALKALQTVFQAGFNNVSVDLLCGVPGQSKEDIEHALQVLTNFPITHLSCYLLTLPPHHKMFQNLPDEETQLDQLLFVHDWLVGENFEHYEISNFARSGKKAMHNLAYWQGKSYLGLGPSAHSYDHKNLQRWKNVSSLHRYVQLLDSNQSVIECIETLNPKQIELERWMLALRLNEGFPVSWLQSPTQKKKAEIFKNQGLLEIHPLDSHKWRLTPRGFALSDPIIQGLA